MSFLLKTLSAAVLFTLGVASARADSFVDALATNTTIPLPPQSCFYVDQFNGTSYSDTKLCSGWATAIGALSTANNLSDLTNPITARANLGLGSYASLASPALSGTPTAPTAPQGTNSTQIATTAFVKSQQIPISVGWIAGQITTYVPTQFASIDPTQSSGSDMCAKISAAATMLASSHPAAESSTRVALAAVSTVQATCLRIGRQAHSGRRSSSVMCKSRPTCR